MEPPLALAPFRDALALAAREVLQQARATLALAMALLQRLLTALVVLRAACPAFPALGGAGVDLPFFTRENAPSPAGNGVLLQDIVTWDARAVAVRGERLMLFNAEFHPFRLPVPGLWRDVFQKLRAAGFSAVSFYTHWAQLEGKPGYFAADGVFALEPFFAAAKEAGIYLIARPGPYINAEATGGGFPGWLQRAAAVGRTRDFLPYTEAYVRGVGPIIAKAQITNGGPIILFQPENEYTLHTANVTDFPDHEYFAAVSRMWRDQGIVVPFVSNDQYAAGLFAPTRGASRSPPGASRSPPGTSDSPPGTSDSPPGTSDSPPGTPVDIYGYDSYPLGFDCSAPRVWPDGQLQTDLLRNHTAQNPYSPHTIGEFQGGAFDPWGGVGFANCEELVNEEFERVFFKNNYAAGVTVLNVYMGYGGTNWGNLGHPGGYTSYDYGAAIAEDRTVARAKYSEIKLQAHFLRASPAYLTATPEPAGNGSYVSTPEIATSRLASGRTQFFVVRHAAYNSNASTSYRLEVPTSRGNLSLPRSGNLTLNGRDSKIHVVDYDVGGINVLYSTAEVFTWTNDSGGKLLILYGGPNESHEASFEVSGSASIVEGSGVQVFAEQDSVTLNWAVESEPRIVDFSCGLRVLLLSREDAFNYWVLDLPATAPAYNYTTVGATSVIVRGGYLLRTAGLHDSALALTGDINSTTTLEVFNVPCSTALSFNGKSLSTSCTPHDTLLATVPYTPPTFTLPSLRELPWSYLDSLPEIQPNYDDTSWPPADHATTNNTQRPLTTPTSLYASDYGFHAGALLTRGHFTATGAETHLFVETWGGFGYGAAVYLDATLLAGFAGGGTNATGLQNATLPPLVKGKEYVITVVSDNMGLEEDFVVGGDQYKNPRGVVNYELGGRSKADVRWRITGNLGGEEYQDRVRGPLNEGGLFAERIGAHLPGAPTTGDGWQRRSPFQGIDAPGVGFFATSFTLDMPSDYDIPLAFAFANATSADGASARFRCQLFVNGWQFGKYVNHVGPQTRFPVPEGILDYRGANDVALTLWGFDAGGNGLAGLELVSTAAVATGYARPELAPEGRWEEREGAY